MKIRHMSGMLMGAMLFSPAAAFAKGDKTLTIDQLPAEVSKPILAAAGKAELTLKKEKEDGVEAYEAKWQVDGHKHEITVAPSGTVLSQEEMIAPDSSPQAVQAAIKAIGSDLLGLEKVTEKSGINYEAAFKTDEGKLEVKFDSAGKELSRETEKKKEHKEKEEKEEDDED